MNLKRLELSGFKSFARATKLQFPSRITAIVGPNGSGKSNVEDLIFNGSPSAARMGRAVVALVFDNASDVFPLDFEEVAVSRLRISLTIEGFFNSDRAYRDLR